MPPYHQYIVVGPRASLHELNGKEFSDAKKEFLETVLKIKSKVKVFPFSLTGFAGDARLLLWIFGHSVYDTQSALITILTTKLGRHLQISCTLFGITRPSVYSGRHGAPDQTIKEPFTSPYLIVYPFTKTKEWHLLGREARKWLMVEHMNVGTKYKKISQLLLYSFGLDNHEFVVSYATDSLEEFQSLVMDLRATEVRRYTENDKPIFVAIAKPLKTILDEF